MRFSGFTLAALCLLFARGAHASPEDLFGYGARAQAMGATGAASAEGYEAAYANPALLSRLRARKLSLGLEGAVFDLKAAGDRISYARAKGLVIAVDLPIPFGGALEDRVGVGLAFYTPTDVVVRGRILYPETPQYPLLPDRAQSVAIRLGVGADIGHGIKVGAGFAALAEIAGSAVVATDATGRVGTRVEDQLIATYAPTFGVSYDLPLKSDAVWRAGLTYRGTLDARFAVLIDATKLSSLNIPLFNISGLAQYDPAQVALEIARETNGLTLAVGATYKRWSGYPGLLEPTILCPADNPDCGALTPPKIAYDDTIALHAGADWGIPVTRSLTTHARLGIFTDPNPLPSRIPAGQAYDPAQKQTVSCDAGTSR
jgi:long-chain fatty acid transport protein